MDTLKKAITSQSKHNTVLTFSQYSARNVRNCRLVWLISNFDEILHDGSLNTTIKLQNVVDILEVFTNSDECVDCIKDIKDEKVFMIINETWSEMIIPIVQNIPHLKWIYIISENKAHNEKWYRQWPKVKGVYKNILSIYEVLKEKVWQNDANIISISVVKPNDKSSKQDLDQLDPSFMYTQILKEILLNINFEQQHINEFITYYQYQYKEKNMSPKNIHKFKNEYDRNQAIWWYTKDPIFYSTLNLALREMDIDIIIKMGFFLQDLHQNIITLHKEQYGRQNYWKSFTVYRRQGLPSTDFDKLMNSKGGLMSFNNFLSASLIQNVSRIYTDHDQDDDGAIDVLFKITVNPSISSIYFAKIGDISAYTDEEEILFSMYSVFRIRDITKINGNDRRWQIELTLVNDNDPQLHALTQVMLEETSSDYKGWHRLGKLMIKLNKFSKAEELYKILLIQTTNEGELAHLNHMLGFAKYGQGNYPEAIEYYKKSIESKEKNPSLNRLELATSYNNIGLVYMYMFDYTQALSYYKKTLEIKKQILPPTDPSLATTYTNIGTAYTEINKSSEALLYYEKAHEILKTTLPSNHPNLAASYENIGNIYNYIGEYAKALPPYEKALEIKEKTHPPNHPDMVICYNNIGFIHKRMLKYSEALLYYEKALEVRRKILPANHSDIAESHNNIGSVYCDIGEYSKALSYYEKALEIKQQTLPANHPGLAYCFNNIGDVYCKMNNYSEGLTYHKKACKIFEETLPSHLPELATSYTNIGSVYYNMNNYSEALPYFEKALKVYKETLPPNHPNLVRVYDYLAMTFGKIGQPSSAIKYFEQSLSILEPTMAPNHERIIGIKQIIQTLKRRL